MEKKIKVLLVDDEADFTTAMAFWLQSKGYSILVANEGLRAVEMAKSDKPDIIFLDLNMPVMDGAETLKKIREFDTEVPVIIISAYLDDRRAEQVNQYSISGMFYKGSDFSEGLALLETILRRHKKLSTEG